MQAKRQPSCSASLLTELEFSVGVTFEVDLNGQVIGQKVEDVAIVKGQNLYVAIRKSDGACVKIGMTTQSIWRRWKPIVNMIDTQKTLSSLRPNELADQELLRRFCLGQKIEVWHRSAFKLSLEPDQGPRISVNSLYLNELYLDHLFDPLFGRDLSGRNT
jgi:hypothetical protein